MRPILRRLIAPTAIASTVVITTAFCAFALNAHAFDAFAYTHTAKTRTDISGKWTIVAAAPDGAYQAVATFKQEVDALSGTIDSQTLGSAKLAGSVKGDTVKFSFSVDVRGNTMELRVGGLIKDKDNISGQLEAQNGMGTFPFSARRIP